MAQVHSVLDRLVLWTKMNISAVLSVAYAIVLSVFGLVVLGGDFPLTSIFTISAWLVIVGVALHIVMAIARVEMILIPQGKLWRKHAILGIFTYTALYGVMTITVLIVVKNSMFLGVVSGAVASIYWPKVFDSKWISKWVED